MRSVYTTIRTRHCTFLLLCYKIQLSSGILIDKEKEETMMYCSMNHNNMAAMLAEDVNVPVLRNPYNSGMRKARRQNGIRIEKWLKRLLGKK